MRIRWNKDLTKRIAWTALLLMVLELGRQIVLPGMDASQAEQALRNNTLMKLFGNVTGGQMSSPTLFSLGVGPYMTSMILWQAVTLFNSEGIQNLPEEVSGFFQRLITLIIAILQGFQMVYTLRKILAATPIAKIFGTQAAFVLIILMLVGGAMLVAWMADVNANLGIGGLGMMIVPSLATSLPSMLTTGLGIGDRFEYTTVNIVILVIVTLIFVSFTVYLNRAEMRLPLQRPLVENDYAGSYLPIRFLTSGAMPFMFSTSIFMIPTYLITANNQNQPWARFINDYLTYDNLTGIIIYGAVIVFLGYAFAFVNFLPTDVAKNLRNSGDYFYNVAPGDATEQLLIRRLMFMTFFGNCYLVFVAITPLLVGLNVSGYANMSFYFGNLMILITMIDNVIEQVRALANKNNYSLL